MLWDAKPREVVVERAPVRLIVGDSLSDSEAVWVKSRRQPGRPIWEFDGRGDELCLGRDGLVVERATWMLKEQSSGRRAVGFTLLYPSTRTRGGYMRWEFWLCRDVLWTARTVKPLRHRSPRISAVEVSAAVDVVLRQHGNALPPEWHCLSERKATLSPEARSRRALAVATRRAVMNRDGGRCVACGSAENLSFDHIIPFADGGADTVQNLQVLCLPCNRTKGRSVG